MNGDRHPLTQSRIRLVHHNAETEHQIRATIGGLYILRRELRLGRDKSYVSVAHAEKMAKWLPPGSLVIVPGGHAAPVTQSKQVNKALAQFFDIPLTK